MTTEPIISIVIPCHNEEEMLCDVITELSGVLKEYCHEIILIDDGSTDKSVSILQQILPGYPAAHAILFDRNYGQQAAIYAGLCRARGACILVMDCDMHDLLFMIPEMITKWQGGAQGVFAYNQFVQSSHTFKIESALQFYKIYNLFSAPKIKEGLLSFMLVDKHIAMQYTGLQHYHYIAKLALFSFVKNPVYIPTINPKRPKGISKYTLLKMMKLACTALLVLWKIPVVSRKVLNNKTHYTTTPLKPEP